MTGRTSSLDVHAGSRSGHAPSFYGDSQRNSQEAHVSLRHDRIEIARRYTGGQEHVTNRVIEPSTGDRTNNNDNYNNYRGQACEYHVSRAQAAMAQIDQALSRQK